MVEICLSWGPFFCSCPGNLVGQGARIIELVYSFMSSLAGELNRQRWFKEGSFFNASILSSSQKVNIRSALPSGPDSTYILSLKFMS